MDNLHGQSSNSCDHKHGIHVGAAVPYIRVNVFRASGLCMRNVRMALRPMQPALEHDGPLEMGQALQHHLADMPNALVCQTWV